MGAAGFLFVTRECFEHVTEHEGALVGCTCVMKHVHVISFWMVQGVYPDSLDKLIHQVSEMVISQL